MRGAMPVRDKGSLCLKQPQRHKLRESRQNKVSALGYHSPSSSFFFSFIALRQTCTLKKQPLALLIKPLQEGY